MDGSRFDASGKAHTRRDLLRGLAAAVAAASAPSVRPAGAVALVTGHPRLWLTAADLPRLRGWATDANPLWRDGLLVLAAKLSSDMDAGHVPGKDSGGNDWEEYPTENYAEFFAFLSLLHPDKAARASYARRARALLMHAITEAARGRPRDNPSATPPSRPITARGGGARVSP